MYLMRSARGASGAVLFGPSTETGARFRESDDGGAKLGTNPSSVEARLCEA
jgi:hypothetical protein